MNEMDFLTPEEKEQMQSLMAKAAERMRKSERNNSDNESHQFLFLHCQCECRKQMERKEQIKEEFAQDVRTLLDQICTFCRKHGFPMCKREASGDEEDELPLPF